jgi:hypothetical protein
VALLGLLILVLPVSLMVSVVGLFRDRRKGYAIAGLLLSIWPLWPIWLSLSAC